MHEAMQKRRGHPCCFCTRPMAVGTLCRANTPADPALRPRAETGESLDQSLWSLWQGKTRQCSIHCGATTTALMVCRPVFKQCRQHVKQIRVNSVTGSRSAGTIQPPRPNISCLFGQEGAQWWCTRRILPLDMQVLWRLAPVALTSNSFGMNSEAHSHKKLSPLLRNEGGLCFARRTKHQCNHKMIFKHWHPGNEHWRIEGTATSSKVVIPGPKSRSTMPFTDLKTSSRAYGWWKKTTASERKPIDIGLYNWGLWALKRPQKPIDFDHSPGPRAWMKGNAGAYQKPGPLGCSMESPCQSPMAPQGDCPTRYEKDMGDISEVKICCRLGGSCQL